MKIQGLNYKHDTLAITYIVWFIYLLKKEKVIFAICSSTNGVQQNEI